MWWSIARLHKSIRLANIFREKNAGGQKYDGNIRLASSYRIGVAEKTHITATLRIYYCVCSANNGHENIGNNCIHTYRTYGTLKHVVRPIAGPWQ